MAGTSITPLSTTRGGIAHALPAVESIYILILAAVLARNDDANVLAVATLVLAAILFYRFVATGPLVRHEAESELIQDYLLRASLLRDLRAVSSHLTMQSSDTSWTNEQFEHAVTEWLSADVVPSLATDDSFKRTHLPWNLRRQFSTLRASGAGFHSSIVRMGHYVRFRMGAVILVWASPDSVRPKAFITIGARRTALILLIRSIEEGFVEEAQPASTPGQLTDIRYRMSTSPSHASAQ